MSVKVIGMRAKVDDPIERMLLDIRNDPMGNEREELLVFIIQQQRESLGALRDAVASLERVNETLIGLLLPKTKDVAGQ